jgi:hypothetical protein
MSLDLPGSSGRMASHWDLRLTESGIELRSCGFGNLIGRPSTG